MNRLRYRHRKREVGVAPPGRYAEEVDLSDPARREELQGAQLASARSSDLHWREERRSRVQRRMDTVHALKRIGAQCRSFGWGGMVGGLLGLIVCGALTYTFLLPLALLGVLGACVVIAFGLTAFTAGSLMEAVAELSLSWLQDFARRHAIEGAQPDRRIPEQLQ